MKIFKALMWVVALIGVGFVLLRGPAWTLAGREGSITELYQGLESKDVVRVEWYGAELRAQYKDGSAISLNAFDVKSQPGSELVNAIVKARADLILLPRSASSLTLEILSFLAIPLVILLVIYLFVLRPMQAANPGGPTIRGSD